MVRSFYLPGQLQPRQWQVLVTLLLAWARAAAQLCGEQQAADRRRCCRSWGAVWASSSY